MAGMYTVRNSRLKLAEALSVAGIPVEHWGENMKATPFVTISLGEVLWDVFPDGKTLGGAPSNVARHLSQFGCEAHIVSVVGDDGLGQEAITLLETMGLWTDHIAVTGLATTGTVDAIVDEAGNATYVIHKNVAWDSLSVTPETLALASRTRAANFGSLGLRTETARNASFAILDALPAGALRMFDVNLRKPFIDPDILRSGFERATVVKMNDDELSMIAEMFGLSSRAEKAVEDLLAMWPDVRHLLVTRGSEGAWWHNRRILMRGSPAVIPAVADTIGAGDAFTASVMYGLLAGLGEETILHAALAIAAYVCSRRGGMPELPDGLKELLSSGGAR